MKKPDSMHQINLSAPVTLVGAGPVGLLLACLLGQQGKEVRIVEQRAERPEGSMAIGITPPSLDVLNRLNLREDFLERGVRIRQARVYENGRPVGQLDFRSSENAILSLPQLGTLELLEKKMREFPSLRLERGVCFGAEDLAAAPGWVIACDGSRGPIRELAGIGGRGHGYGPGFVMADFPDKTFLDGDARLFFSVEGAVKSFPLPGQQRRWIAQVPRGAGMEALRRRVREAGGIDLPEHASGPLCAFAPRWFLAGNYVKGRVILCGDAAHVMSPIGGQGMNTGFGDAMMLSETLRSPSPDATARYNRERRRAFRIAARRAAWGMWLGTRRGKTASRARAALLKKLLSTPRGEETLIRCYSMRNLPHPCNP